jgi:hypothetical protein
MRLAWKQYVGMWLISLGLFSSCSEELGEGVLLNRSYFSELSAIERERSRNLFDGDYYYRVQMISGKYAGDTINAVLIESRNNIGDTVRVLINGKDHDFFLISTSSSH